MEIEHLSKKNLLDYVQAIGGEKMYFGFERALREAGVFDKPELNRRQLQTTIRKFLETEETNINRMKIEKLLDEHERRRQAYVKMAIDADIDREQAENPEAFAPIGGFGGNKRYDYKKASQSLNHVSITGKRATSSIANTQREKNIQNAKSLGGPKKISGPITSISQLNRLRK